MAHGKRRLRIGLAIVACSVAMAGFAASTSTRSFRVEWSTPRFRSAIDAVQGELNLSFDFGGADPREYSFSSRMNLLATTKFAWTRRWLYDRFAWTWHFFAIPSVCEAMYIPGQFRSQGYFTIKTICWIPIALTLASSAPWLILGWRAHRRANRPGRCRDCGYDLGATPPGAPCPECGRPADCKRVNAS